MNDLNTNCASESSKFRDQERRRCISINVVVRAHPPRSLPRPPPTTTIVMVAVHARSRASRDVRPLADQLRRRRHDVRVTRVVRDHNTTQPVRDVTCPPSSATTLLLLLLRRHAD